MPQQGTYDEHDVARWAPEHPVRPGRSEFARDRARVLHSAALRRLAAKTQVVVAGEGDFPRTRLTHSLEVAQIGRELGLTFGADPDLVEVGCLSHDLGHPPFGHNGEQALDEVAKDIGGFEGNAQTFRILTRLEAKTFWDGNSVGLNLTRASLDASTKYPWPRREGERKFGVYAEDEPAFAWMRKGAPESVVCFEAQLMDFADDVAYSVHDVEDAIHGGYLNPGDLYSGAVREAVLLASREGPSFTGTRSYMPGTNVPRDPEAALDRLLALPLWMKSFQFTLEDFAKLKALTSYLIGRFVRSTVGATRKEYGDGPLIRYGANLIVLSPMREEIEVLKALAHVAIRQRPNVEAERLEQRGVITNLAKDLVSNPANLEPIYRQWFATADTDDQKLRVIVDQIASLTDYSVVTFGRDA